MNEKKKSSHRCFLLKEKDSETGGIKTTKTDSNGRKLSYYDIGTGMGRLDVSLSS